MRSDPPLKSPRQISLPSLSALSNRADTTLTLSILGNAIFWAIASSVGTNLFGVGAALTGVAIVAWWAWTQFVRPLPLIRLMQSGGVALVAILNIGYVGAWTVATFKVSVPFEILVNEIYGISMDEYSLSMVFSMLFAAAMTVYSRISFIEALEGQLMRSLRGIWRTPVLWVVAISLFIMFVEGLLLGTGVVGYRSFKVEGLGKGEIPWYFNFFSCLKAAQIPLNVFLMVSALRKKNVLLGVVGFGGFALALIMAFTTGRSGLILAFIYHFFYWVILCAGRVNKLKLSLMIGVGLLCLYPLTIFNNFIRSSASGVQDARGRDLGQVIMEAANSYKYKESQTLAEEASDRNLATRPLLAHPIAVVQNVSSSESHFGWGQEYMNAFMWSVPRFIFPGKVRYAVQEEYIYQRFGVIFSDTSDSIYLSGYLNFGWLGWLLGPIPLLVLWGASLLLIGLLKTTVAKVIVFSQWINPFYFGVGEMATVSWIGTMRTVVAIFVILWVVEIFVSERVAVSTRQKGDMLKRCRS
jgi:hypothetical protein